MTRQLSFIISWICLLVLLALPLVALWLLFDLDVLVDIARSNIPLPIIWESVVHSQLITFWVISALYMSIGLIGLYYLRRSFLNFAKGRLFDSSNTHDLRLFSICILIQGVATPVYYAFIGVLLSWNHPAGQKILSIMLGSNELRSIGLSLVFWVICDLLVEAENLKKENQQFV